VNELSTALQAFDLIDIRVGTIVEAQPFPEARKPAYKLSVDLGAQIGLRHSSVQITENYQAGALIGTPVLAVVNFPPKRIAGFQSEILVLGLPDAEGHVVLIRPDCPVPNGGRLF